MSQVPSFTHLMQYIDTPIRLGGYSYTARQLVSLDGAKRFYDEIAGNFVFSTTESPLSSEYTLIATLIGYIVVSYTLSWIFGVKKEGEKDRQGLYHSFLKLCSIAHNFNMMIISIACFAGIIYEAYNIFARSPTLLDGGFEVICDPGHRWNRGKLSFWLYVYYLSKFYELLDTLLIVARRAPLRFIHTYHHVTTMTIAYAGMWTNGTGQWIIILLNVSVHIIMYYYYLLVCLGVKNIWWKNHLTDVQLTQFVLDAFFFGLYIYFDVMFMRPVGKTCTGSLIGASSGFVLVITFFILFLRLRIANTLPPAVLLAFILSAVVLTAIFRRYFRRASSSVVGHRRSPLLAAASATAADSDTSSLLPQYATDPSTRYYHSSQFDNQQTIRRQQQQSTQSQQQQRAFYSTFQPQHSMPAAATAQSSSSSGAASAAAAPPLTEDPMTKYDEYVGQIEVAASEDPTARWNLLRRYWTEGRRPAISTSAAPQEGAASTAYSISSEDEDESSGAASSSSSQPKKKKFKAEETDVEDIVEKLLDANNPPFTKPVPLGMMVNILQEIWESDYLYD